MSGSLLVRTLMQYLPMVDRRSSSLHPVNLLIGNEEGVCANRSE